MNPDRDAISRASQDAAPLFRRSYVGSCKLRLHGNLEGFLMTAEVIHSPSLAFLLLRVLSAYLDICTQFVTVTRLIRKAPLHMAA